MNDPARYTLRWISLRDACRFVALWHRHHQPPQGGIGAVACYCEDKLIGVAIIGRPVARLLGGMDVAEITRTCIIEGHPNAGSWLYTRAKRLAQAWGFRRVVSYTIPGRGENGASLRAAGFVPAGLTAGGGWSRSSRVRMDAQPLDEKLRWEASA